MSGDLTGRSVVVYARFSSENQRDTSIDDQVRLCREDAGRRGAVVANDSVLTDYAASGASSARAGFEELLRRIESRKVDVVLTESGDRLSRDLGDADRLWKLCEFHGVRLILVSDGIDSAREGSRMAFQFRAVMSDQYLVDLGKKTIRGQIGHFERKLSVGGMAFGYTSRPVGGDPRNPDGFEPEIDEARAAIVIRIFTAYARGESYLSIATALNRDGVPAPRARARWKDPRRGKRGWVDTTIREMLSNEAYVGRWTFLKRSWRKEPGTGKRRYRERGAEEHRADERPHLRIVPQDLWEAVQERRAAVAAKYARTGPTKKAGASTAPGRPTRYPFSGVLVCGLCGSSLMIVGGTSARYYRCGDAHKRGTCANRAPLREDVAATLLMGALREALLDTGGIHYVRRRYAAKVAEIERDRMSASRQAAADLAEAEAQVRRLVRFVGSTDDDAALQPVRSELAEANRRLERLRAAAAALTSPRKAIELPSPDEIKAAVFDLEARMRSSATTAREALRKTFRDGIVTVHPLPDGAFELRGEIVPFALPVVLRAEKPNPRAGGEPGGGRGENVYSQGCAGAIPPEYTAVLRPISVIARRPPDRRRKIPPADGP